MEKEIGFRLVSFTSILESPQTILPQFSGGGGGGGGGWGGGGGQRGGSEPLIPSHRPRQRPRAREV